MSEPHDVAIVDCGGSDAPPERARATAFAMADAAAATAAIYFNTPSTTLDAANRPSAMTLARHKNCCRALRLS
jgi:hypothetical protein